MFQKLYSNILKAIVIKDMDDVLLLFNSKTELNDNSEQTGKRP